MYIHNSKLFNLVQKYPWLSKIFTITDGYIPDEEDDRDYMFGAENLMKKVIKEDGQWTDVLPEDEIQKGRYVETMGCTGFAMLNVLEMLAKAKYGETWNKSDRYTNEMTGTTRKGNGLRNVMNITKDKAGVVNEEAWTWDKNTFTWSQYYSDIPQRIKDLGSAFLKEYQIGYERVTTNKQLMMQALKYSPLYVAGYAWYNQGGLYRSYGKANHAFTIVGYVEGSHWLAYDSYSPYLKKLAWDFQFATAYVIVLAKKDEEYAQEKLNALLKRGFRYIMRADTANGGHGEVYRITEDGLTETTEQEKKDWAITALVDKKDLTGISENDYYSLLK